MTMTQEFIAEMMSVGVGARMAGRHPTAVISPYWAG